MNTKCTSQVVHSKFSGGPVASVREREPLRTHPHVAAAYIHFHQHSPRSDISLRTNLYAPIPPREAAEGLIQAEDHLVCEQPCMKLDLRGPCMHPINPTCAIIHIYTINSIPSSSNHGATVHVACYTGQGVIPATRSTRAAASSAVRRDLTSASCSRTSPRTLWKVVFLAVIELSAAAWYPQYHWKAAIHSETSCCVLHICRQTSHVTTACCSYLKSLLGLLGSVLRFLPQKNS